jgi:hypothetical protein
MATVNGRCPRLRDGVTATRASLCCSLVLIFLDVVLDGSYFFSAAICPVWFIVAVVRVMARRPSLCMAAARVLIPLVTGLLVVANYSVQKRIAMGNAARLIQACEHYREVNGAFPERLGDLVPRYLDSVPRAKYCCSLSEFGYHGAPRHILFWWECPPFGRKVYTFETGQWQYMD